MLRSRRSVAPPEALDLIAGRFRLLGEPNRLRLLMELEQGPRTVSELVAATGMTQANVSRHLQALARGGLLARRREGTRVFYRIADPTIFELCDLVCGSLRDRLTGQARALPRPRR